MKRVARLLLGVVLIAVLFAWLILRMQEPLSTWTASSTLTGWVFHGAAVLSFLSGIALLASVWSPRGREDRDDTGTSEDTRSMR